MGRRARQKRLTSDHDLRRTLCAAAAAAPFAVWPFAAHAEGDGIALMQARAENRPDGLYLTASWEFDLAITLIESLRRGIALYFVCEMRLQKKRWYWFDENLVHAELVQRNQLQPALAQLPSLDGRPVAGL